MKKQITLDGENSDWFEKAIFVLKDKPSYMIPNNLFKHAEELIENYMKKNPSKAYINHYEKMQRAYGNSRPMHQAWGKKQNIEMIKTKNTLRKPQGIDYFLNFCIVVLSIGIVVVLSLMLF
ncbi:hypothetical protein CS063_05860 [Sporanaerobium hydrogeniformans]|uniref:Uncharacterized protein n=1 Tax=Sporanaerobium hydrogeniformans TaxID=3072179 RepID=A0AC61DEU7_9FIRM|nr:hypothetical protein [Sporanaerobium hydrogeniformans]PHV71216.1 hypothetical protein CS063_05860 [Sporanaerobium hydrogeniformans]